MDQYTLGLYPLPKKTRKEVFLNEMNQLGGDRLDASEGNECCAEYQA